MPDEKSKTEPDLDLASQWYTAAAQEDIAEGARFVTWFGSRHADLTRQLQHVSYAVQDFTSVVGTQGLGQAFAASQNTMGNIQHDAQEQTAKRKREQVEKGLEPRTDSKEDQDHDQDQEQDKDIQDDANVHAQVRGDNELAANASSRGVDRNTKNPESGQAKDKAQADWADPRTIFSEILKQQNRILQMSQNTTLNQVKAQALMAQLGARIDQLNAQQRQLNGNWRRLRMEGQNRTYQNMGGN